MANGNRVSMSYGRRFTAIALAALGLFVVSYGIGFGNPGIMAVGVAVGVLGPALLILTAVRATGRQYIFGTAHVHSASPPPSSGMVGRCELHLSVSAAGIDGVAVRVLDPAVPVSKWPDDGATLPVEVVANNPRKVRVLWDKVVTHAQAAGEDLYPQYVEELSPDVDDQFDDDLPFGDSVDDFFDEDDLPPVPAGPPPTPPPGMRTRTTTIAAAGMDFAPVSAPMLVPPAAAPPPGAPTTKVVAAPARSVASQSAPVEAVGQFGSASTTSIDDARDGGPEPRRSRAPAGPFGPGSRAGRDHQNRAYVSETYDPDDDVVHEYWREPDDSGEPDAQPAAATQAEPVRPATPPTRRDGADGHARSNPDAGASEPNPDDRPHREWHRPGGPSTLHSLEAHDDPDEFDDLDDSDSPGSPGRPGGPSGSDGSVGPDRSGGPIGPGGSGRSDGPSDPGGSGGPIGAGRSDGPSARGGPGGSGRSGGGWSANSGWGSRRGATADDDGPTPTASGAGGGPAVSLPLPRRRPSPHLRRPSPRQRKAADSDTGEPGPASSGGITPVYVAEAPSDPPPEWPLGPQPVSAAPVRPESRPEPDHTEVVSGTVEAGSNGYGEVLTGSNVDDHAYSDRSETDRMTFDRSSFRALEIDMPETGSNGYEPARPPQPGDDADSDSEEDPFNVVPLRVDRDRAATASKGTATLTAVPEPDDPEPDAAARDDSDDDEPFAAEAGSFLKAPTASLSKLGSSGFSLTLFVRELTRSVAFYRDTLGLAEVDIGKGSAVLARGNSRIVLKRVVDLQPVGRRIVHLNLEVPDVQAAYRELKGKGVEFLHEPRVVSHGEQLELWAATFRDPDGHAIALTHWEIRR